MSAKDRAKSAMGGKKKDEYPWLKDQGMGTPVAEYSEAGPFRCGNCWYLKNTDPRHELGLCNEPHILKDPQVPKKKVDGEKYGVVNKEFGCCRFIDPVKPVAQREGLVVIGDPEEEAEEHGVVDPDEESEGEDDQDRS